MSAETHLPIAPSYSRDEALALVSISGGKDSLATALVALEQLGRERVRLVHADTGNEHPLTESYVRDYLPKALGLPIKIVTADLAHRVIAKRAVVETKWRREGVPEEICAAAIEMLVPTGNPFLDLCIWKGRFPSRMAQFCTEELKRYPLDAYTCGVIAATNLRVESWQGVRRDESLKRRDALDWEIGDLGVWVHRPIAAWTAEQTFEIARRFGIDSNPLYRLGMGRVGCMPCINCGKDEIAEISTRFPEVIDRIRRWEAIVSTASKRQLSTFFFFDEAPGRSNMEHAAANQIDQAVAWSRTSRGGKQYSLERLMPREECSSVYGLCE